VDGDFIAMLRPFLPYLDDQEILPDARLRDLGLDSMREVQLLFAVEDTYGIVLPDEMLTDTTFATAGQLWTAITELTARQGA
jgi:acyl carrier protein